MQINKLDKYFKTAEAFAQLSPDEETKVGSILVHNETNAVMGMAYNGFIRGADDSLLPTTRPFKYRYMRHSELNLICHAAGHGINTSQCFVVCTLSPCIDCLRALYQARITTVYFKDTYRDFEKSLNMSDLFILLTNVGNYTRIDLKGKKK